jgi:DNA-3-methyladenine glycosylase II
MQETQTLPLLTHFTLSIPRPFDFRLTVAKPAGWHWSTPREIFDQNTLWTAVYSGDRPLGLRLSAQAEAVEVDVYGQDALPQDEENALKRRIRAGLGGDEDLAGFYAVAHQDPLLAETVEDLHGMRLGRLDDLFGRVILAITLQMAPLARSMAMLNAVLEHYGKTLLFDDHGVILWPLPRELAAVDVDLLRSEANLGYRAKRLSAAARFLAEHPFYLSDLDTMSEQEALKRLEAIPGIGEYSASLILARSQVPLDVWSVVIMSELLLGENPAQPREAIPSVTQALVQRWGEWAWMAFAYVVNDLERLAPRYGLSRIH